MKITTIAATLIMMLMGGCGFINNLIMDGKHCPQYVKLADFTNDIASARLTWPQGDPWGYNLLLALPIPSPTNWPIYAKCPDFTGIVTVKDSAGVEIGRYDISSATAQHCNWLTSYSLDAFITGWQQTNCLKTAARSGREYNITVVIPSRPKEFTSLWLGFLQSGEQFRKSHESAN
jgi:hypothetical protein